MIILLCIVFANPFVVQEQFSKIELNHFFDECGRAVYSQLIFWQHNRSAGRDEVRHWRLYNAKDDRIRFGCEFVNFSWMDLENEQNLFTFRDAKSRSFVETFSQTDPERANKKILDERNRVQLIKRDKQ